MKILKNLTALILTFCSLWAIGFAAFAAFAITAPPRAPEQTTDAIVVLTGGDNRIQEGLSLFAHRKARHLFISGVHKDVTKNDLTNLWQSETPLPPCCLTLGYKATSTEQNAEETSDWIREQKFTSIRLVTGNYHMARSLMELHHALPGVEIYIHPVQQADLDIKNQRFWSLLLLEYHKTLYRAAQLLFLPLTRSDGSQTERPQIKRIEP
ncbi:MAG: YdcF family protein [Alphaproteobacteria bacterium]|nr:YdcF family protein [Alphaproteobacteria bacterium]